MAPSGSTFASLSGASSLFALLAAENALNIGASEMSVLRQFTLPAPRLGRRQWLREAAAASAGCLLAAPPAGRAAGDGGLVASIEKVVLRRDRDGSGPTWFHPRACIVPGEKGPMAFMTLQTITGSDYFGPVHWMESRDLGRTWTEPRPVPPLGRVRQADGWEEGVCDVVPEFHPRTAAVLATGHNVFHTTNVSPGQSWVTDGEILPKHGFRGDLLLARIRWRRPNRLAG
jgi:hypothetical protein